MSIDESKELVTEACEAVLTPLARLCVAHGLPFAQAEELFKRAFVRAAREARREAGAPAARDVSQVSTATGIGRREVSRITAELQPLAAQRTSPASQVLLRWASNRKLRGRNGQPRPLPRTGPAPSFESLAQSVTRHVHPRSLLDELCRLGLAELSEDGQTVSLLADRFVPDEDAERLFGFLGANVGDHLAAATANVVHRDRRHFEQALFTNELSAPAAAELRLVAKKLWATVSAAAIPELERLMAEDKTHGRIADRRARLGMYSYHEPTPETDHEEVPDPTAP